MLGQKLQRNSGDTQEGGMEVGVHLLGGFSTRKGDEREKWGFKVVNTYDKNMRLSNDGKNVLIKGNKVNWPLWGSESKVIHTYFKN